MSHILFALALIAALAAAVPGTSGAQQQTGAQRSCIAAFNKTALRLAGVRARSFDTCLVEVVGGRADIQRCYTSDSDHRIAATEAKLAAVDTKRCASAAPDFGHAALSPATGTASAESVALVRQLHSVLPPALPPAAAPCIDVVHERAQKLWQHKLKAFLRCAKLGLARGTVNSPETLAACLDAAKAAGDTKVAKLVALAEQAVAKSCPTSDYLAGCGPEQSPAGVAACMDRIADCRACRFARGVADVGADCDGFDDGALNESCPDACGNGTVSAATGSWPAEACDDANLVSGDGCDYDCTVSGCGNGVLTDGEVCDRTRGRCEDGDLDGAPCQRNEQCGAGTCTSCPPGGCSNCGACSAGTCCDTMFGCLFLHDVEQECDDWAGTLVACDAPACQHAGTCCKHLYLDWGGCHSDPFVLANCEGWQGKLAPCTECEPCCAFDGYCTSWHGSACLEYEGTPVDCAQCWTP